MRRVVSWAGLACGLLLYVLLGLLLGWDTSALRADLFPLLFGGAAALIVDANMERGL